MYNVYRGVDQWRAVQALAQSFGRRYPAAYQTVKKALVRSRLWHSGAWHRPEVSATGSDPKVSTRPTAGVSETIANGIGHASGS